MRRWVSIRLVVCVVAATGAPAQKITVIDAPTVSFPSETDSNSPAFWRDGNLVLYNSTGNGPVRSTGQDQYHLGHPEAAILGPAHRPAWIESVWTDSDGTVFAWYHHEPAGLCGKSRVTAPQIGALVSYDSGRTFYDLGIILASAYGVDCASPNGFFGGGNGDFSVVAGPSNRYLYFFFSNYGGPREEQGVAVARMPFAQRLEPAGTVQKYFEGKWEEPGIGGHVTPILKAAVSWQEADTDAFWGPSVHWNTYLNQFVMLLNHSCCSPGWPQEGIYASFTATPSEPASWSKPARILDGVGWYPQVMGLTANGTDRLAGQKPRLYVFGVSSWQLLFEKPDRNISIDGHR